MELVSLVCDVLIVAAVGWAAWRHVKHRESNEDAMVRRAQEVARVAIRASGGDWQKAVDVFKLFDVEEDGKRDWNDKQVGEFLSAAKKEIENGSRI